MWTKKLLTIQFKGFESFKNKKKNHGECFTNDSSLLLPFFVKINVKMSIT